MPFEGDIGSTPPLGLVSLFRLCNPMFVQLRFRLELSFLGMPEILLGKLFDSGLFLMSCWRRLLLDRLWAVLV